MNENYQKLYDFMSSNGMTNLSAEDWYGKYSQPDNFDQFYNTITDPEVKTPLVTNLSREAFYSKYFGDDLKKKDEQLAQVAPTTLPSVGEVASAASPSSSDQDPTASGLPALPSIDMPTYAGFYQGSASQVLENLIPGEFMAGPYMDSYNAVKNNSIFADEALDEVTNYIVQTPEVWEHLGLDIKESQQGPVLSYPTSMEDQQKEARYQTQKLLRRKMYDQMGQNILASIPQEERTPERLKDYEQYMLENYNALIDLTGEGEVGNTPFLDANLVYGPGLKPTLELSGYLPDLFSASGIDVINGFYNFFGGDAKTVEERRKKAEEIRASTLHFVDGVREGDFSNAVKQSMGFLSESAPILMVTLPAASATAGMGLGMYATVGLTAAESATVMTMQEWARVRYNPDWSIYKKGGKEYSYQEALMMTGGDAERLATEFTVDDNFMGKVGYLSNVGVSSLIADGASTALFLRALKGTSPYNAVTKDMSTWWNYHLKSAGIAIPTGSVTNSIASMRQYVAQQEALGNEVSWAEVREVGYDAALTGGVLGGAISAGGSMINLALASDPFGRGGKNMEFYRQEQRLLQEYETAKTPQERAMINEAMQKLVKQNMYGRLEDGEFYSQFSQEDALTAMEISHEMNRKYRQLLKIGDPESAMAKKLAGEIDELSKARFAIEEPYEVQMMVHRGEDPTLVNDDGGALATPTWGPRRGPVQPEDLEPLQLLAPRNTWEKGIENIYGTEGVIKFRNYYESLVDAFDAPRRVQQAIEKQRGERVPLDQDLDVALRTVESKAAAEVDKARALRGEKLIPMLQAFHGKVNKKTPGADLLPRGVKPTGLSMLDRYLYALHAPERNAQIYAKHEAEAAELRGKKNLSPKEKKRLKRLEEYMTTKNGSGMSDADAAAFIDALEPSMKADLDAMVGEVRNIQQHTRDLLYESGMISKSHYDYLNSNFEHYVNLSGRAVDEILLLPDGRPAPDNSGLPNVPARLQVNKDMLTEALGRKGETADLFTKTLLQETAAIIMANRNQTNQKMLNLLEANPDPTSYTISSEGKAGDPGTVVVYRDGEPFYVQFKDESIAKNLKYMSPRTTDEVIKDTEAFIRYAANMRKFFVNYNPTFGPVAYTRDTQTAYVHALSQAEREFGVLLDADGARINSNQLLDLMTENQGTSLRMAMSQEVRGGKFGDLDNALGKVYEEFRAYGGVTGWAYMDELTSLQRKLDKEVAPKGKLRIAGDWFQKNSIKLIEEMNNGYENAARFNAYRSARALGVPAERAAAFAKMVTVDFNRRGTAARQIGAYKFFFNPAIQGIDQSIGVMSKPKAKVTPEGKERNFVQRYSVQGGVFSSIAAMGILMSEWNDQVGGVGPDGVPYYDKIPDGIKRRNMIIMLPGSEEYVKLPKTYGYGAFYDYGVAAYDMLTDKRSVGSAAMYAANSTWENFMPFYLSDTQQEDAQKLPDPQQEVMNMMVDLISPDAAKPMVYGAMNRTAFGTPITRERKGFSRSGSAYRSPEIVQEVFDRFNEWGGGTKYKSGSVAGFSTDINPDRMWYVGESVLGGLAMFATQSGETLRDYRALRTGDFPNSDILLDPDNIPFVRQFYSDSYENQLYRDYYEMKERLDPYRREFADWRELNKNIQVQLSDRDTPKSTLPSHPDPEMQGEYHGSYDDAMGKFDQDSREFRYMAYLTTRDLQAVVDDFLNNEGLDLMYEMNKEELAELKASPFSSDSTLNRYAELTIQREKQDQMRFALIAAYLNYANQVMPRDN